MIILLNVIVPIVILGLSFYAYKIQKWWPVLVAIAFSLIYGLVQPSYMPKGVVKPMAAPIEFRQVEGPMTDRMLKPKSAEQYDIERKAALDAIDQSIREQISKSKQGDTK